MSVSRKAFWHKIAVMVIVSVLIVPVLAACGNDEEEDNSTTPLATTATPPTIPATSPTQAPPSVDNLPPYITWLTTWGQRADWSHDGQRILFMEKTFGDVFEIDLKTKELRPMTHHYFHEGYTRALYLSNGDILLAGARGFDANDPWPSRTEENAELWILKHDLSGPPVALGEKISEGPAVSRAQMRIAWTQKNKFYLGDISYQNGTPKIVEKRMILDKQDLDFTFGSMETQNFRPPEEKEIIFTVYAYQGGEVMGVNIDTGEVINYSNDNASDEPEGIFPDGHYTLVESDKHIPEERDTHDLHKLALDGSGKYQRITHFSDYPGGWESGDGVVSDDGSFIAFQCAKNTDPPGVGRGILILDLEMYEKISKDNDKTTPIQTTAENVSPTTRWMAKPDIMTSNGSPTPTATSPTPTVAAFTIKSALGELIENLDTQAILRECLGDEAVDHPDLPKAYMLDLPTLVVLSGGMISDEMVACVDANLKALASGETP